MISVFRHTLRGYRTALALVGLGVFGLTLLIVYIFEAFGGVEAMQELLEFMPEGVRGLLKAQGEFATTANGYLGAQYRHPVYMVALAAFAISASSGAVARDVERGTILFILGAPLARWRLLTAKGAAMVVGLLALLAAAWMGTWVGTLVTGITDQVQMTVFLRVQVNALALVLAIGGYALLISALSSEGGHTISLAAGIAVVMFFLDFLTTLWSPSESLGPLSLFHYYDPLAIAQGGGMPWRDVGVLLGVAAAAMAVAVVAFQRRDIVR